MKLASMLLNGRPAFGLVKGDRVVDLSCAFSGRASDLMGLLREELLNEVTAASAESPSFALDEVILLPPIPKPGKTLCVGINYHGRPNEFGQESSAFPKYPSLFLRCPSAQVGHLQTLLRPPESAQMDYEGEIALVIGKGGRRITREQALEHVAGYACYNDGSIRDWMRHGRYNVTAGKNFVASGSFGPWMVTRDEVRDPQALRLETRVNGAIVQQDTTANLIRPFDQLIEYISTFTLLEPGDVIATGTPTGTASKMPEPRWLKNGDVVEVEVSGIGTLRNQVVDEVV